MDDDNMTNILAGIGVSGVVTATKMVVLGAANVDTLSAALPIAIPFGCFAWYMSARMQKTEDKIESLDDKFNKLENKIERLDCLQCDRD